ncbi:MAG: hypothetical protein RLZZ59_198, partial [Pseudomonadota bacterium]
MVAKNKLLKIKDVSLTLDNHLILQDVNLELFEGEIVAIIGRSGCGKSTLMRLITRLIEPSKGEITYYKDNTESDAPNTSMAFQSFGLFPWLNVKDNISIGLKSSGCNKSKVEKATNEIIELIGLSGYENAYPREMSSGMKQRVGIARALVIEPEIMIMDQPFSSLDVLTANTLKNDIMDLWIDDKMPLKSIILVTHNIEEAVMLAHRVVVLSSNPGTVAAEIEISMKYPRNIDNPEFRDYVSKVYSKITSSKFASTDIYTILPCCTSNSSIGCLEFINKMGGELDIGSIETGQNFEFGDIFALTDFLELLKFIEIKGHKVKLTASGKILAEASIIPRKGIFAEHLMRNVPIVARIYNDLKASGGQLRGEVIIELLSRKLSKSNVKKIFKAVVNWGR